MANILVLGVKVPYTSGGQEVLVRDLVRQLKYRGHNADLLELPFSGWPKENILNQAAYWRTLDFDKLGGEKTDLIIASKFPTYFAKHTKKSVWLVHQHRPLYDLYGTRFADFSDDPRDEELRKILTAADKKCLSEADYIAGISANVVKRLEKYNNIKAEVAYPPLPQGNAYYCNNFDNYILSVGRLCNIKRVDLMIKSLPGISKEIKLKVVGTADEPGVIDYYKNEIAKHHLEDRVKFLGRVSNEDLLRLFANALAVYYAPYNEDYGYITLEAFASSKPLITATDSGGTLEFVKHNENGLILEPDTNSMAAGIQELVMDKEKAITLGKAGRKFIESSGLDSPNCWDKVIEKLLSPLKVK